MIFELVARVVARRTIRAQACRACGGPRGMIPVTSDLPADFLLVDPANYCSAECVEKGNNRSVW